jgi:hypothetical protein
MVNIGSFFKVRHGHISNLKMPQIPCFDVVSASDERPILQVINDAGGGTVVLLPDGAASVFIASL